MTKINFEITDPNALAKQYPQFVTFVPTVNKKKVRQALELGLALDGVKMLDEPHKEDAISEPAPVEESAEPAENESVEVPEFLVRGAKNMTA